MQYIKECLQLLYWIYFKPYTLKQHVREICHNIFINPYYGKDIYRLPELQRYNNQGWWLTVLVPIPTVFFSVFIAEIKGHSFVWPAILELNSVFLTGWLSGQLIARTARGKISLFLLIIITMALFFTSWSLLLQYVADHHIRSVAFGVILGMVTGLALGVLFGPLLGIALATVFGMLLSTAFGIELSIAVGVVLGVAFGLVFCETDGIEEGLQIGVVLGMVFGATFGTVAGVSFILGVLRVYFWLPELLWTILLKFWFHPATAKLRFLPPQFDQLIILPLPFLPSLITEAYHENQTAARSTINYLISSTNQQKTASKAMLLIAAEKFRRCRKASDIAEVREQLNWLPASLTGKISLCLDLSQDTAAALEASSPFRQEERLRKICGKIDQQRNALAAASAREATTLGAVLDQWQGILSTACRTLHETARRSGEIPQVYLPGPPLEPDKAGSLFKGRRDLFRQIESLLLSAQPPTLVMQGNRRSGKSSALRYLPKQMPSDILPLFVDCQGAAVSSTLPGFARHLAEQLLASARTTHRLNLPPPDKDELASDPFAALLAWLDTVEQAAPGKTFLICLDEFERIDEIVTATGSRAPLNFLRHLIQHRRCWQLLFAGSHMPDELAPHWSDCLINTRSLRVSCLDKDDAVELICRPVPDFPEIWPDVAVEEVWQLTQGQPFLIQLLCQEAVEHLNRRKAKTVQPGDVAAILPAAFEHGHYYFDEFWRALTEEQRLLLATLAKREAVPPELNQAAAVLLRKEVLVQENNGYAFKVRLIREWIAAKGKPA